MVTIRHCKAGFPLIAEQKARVMRLKRMLADAKRYERACARVERRFNVAKLQRTISVLFRGETELIDKIEAVSSTTAGDVLAKIRVYRVDLSSTICSMKLRESSEREQADESRSHSRPDQGRTAADGERHS
jgi:hypothetical protein